MPAAAALPQQPLSLPPIQGTTIVGTGAVSRSAALPSAASTSEVKPSSPPYASGHTGFSLSTGKVPLSGLMSSGIKVCCGLVGRGWAVAVRTGTQQYQ